MVAFADLAAGMVLSVSAETSRMQEEMNGLCATAVETLNGDAIEQLMELFGSGAKAGIFEVIIMERREIGVFLRSTVKHNDAICCVCTPRISLSEFLPVARAAVDAPDAAPWA